MEFKEFLGDKALGEEYGFYDSQWFDKKIIEINIHIFTWFNFL